MSTKVGTLEIDLKTKSVGYTDGVRNDLLAEILQELRLRNLDARPTVPPTIETITPVVHVQPITDVEVHNLLNLHLVINPSYQLCSVIADAINKRFGVK